MQDLFNGYANGPIYADSHLIVTRTDHPTGLRFAGEIDISNSDSVAQSIRIALADGSRSHVDVSALSFIDVSGIRALVEAAQHLGEGYQLLVHGLAPQLETVLRVTGWIDVPALVLCDCEVDPR